MESKGHNAPPGYHPDEVNCDSPCRETFQSRLAHMIQRKERELTALRQMAKIAANLESGSPLEELLWSMSHNIERNLL